MEFYLSLDVLIPKFAGFIRKCDVFGKIANFAKFYFEIATLYLEFNFGFISRGFFDNLSKNVDEVYSSRLIVTFHLKISTFFHYICNFCRQKGQQIIPPSPTHFSLSVDYIFGK